MRALPTKPAVICGVPCHYGGLSAARKHSSTELGAIWKCNRRVTAEGDRCYQHRDPPLPTHDSTDDPPLPTHDSTDDPPLPTHDSTDDPRRGEHS